MKTSSTCPKNILSIFLPFIRVFYSLPAPDTPALIPTFNSPLLYPSPGSLCNRPCCPPHLFSSIHIPAAIESSLQRVHTVRGESDTFLHFIASSEVPHRTRMREGKLSL
ncbi:hypothetical protein VTN31DRAFT_5713 [Thermomyces dupontii]|uniref:uncharacterized protein n=1 Tax=Talaromyces thermophilus TaxID=28565 RepID=UPI00374256E7